MEHQLVSEPKDDVRLILCFHSLTICCTIKHVDVAELHNVENNRGDQPDPHDLKIKLLRLVENLTQ